MFPRYAAVVGQLFEQDDFGQGVTPFIELMLGVAMSVSETALLGVHSVDRRRG
jgi:hypothetical protein